MSAVKYQLELFWLALGFFSRLPIPANTPYSEERMNQAGRYFALVGLLLGALCALCFALVSMVLPTPVAIFIMMCFSLMLTGAFHEDGLTDMADGIGGGMTLERRLTIMKDSRIGTYGASTLVMALLGKFVLLSELAKWQMVIPALVASYVISRGVAASLIHDTPYVSDIDTSKSKPLANKQSQVELVVLLASSLIPMLWLELSLVVSMLVVIVPLRFVFRTWLLKRIGGFTGDCLGAAQQLSELTLYMVILIWLGGH